MEVWNNSDSKVLWKIQYSPQMPRGSSIKFEEGFRVKLEDGN